MSAALLSANGSALERSNHHKLSGHVLSYDHITFWVGNAKQAATYYCIHFGFKPLAYHGLESGSRERVYHVIQQDSIIIVFVSPLEPHCSANEEMNSFLAEHGDGVRDVAFRVDCLDQCLKHALQQGALLLKKPWTMSSSGNLVRLATVQTFGDVTHTFVERSESSQEDYHFLPGYAASPLLPQLNKILDKLPQVGLQFTDHVVGHFPEGQLESVTWWYEKALKFHRFWSVDENVLSTPYSGIRSHIVTNGQESIKMPLCEVVPPDVNSPKARAKGHEYIHYNGGRAGIHHIAFHTDNMVKTVKELRNRGVEFLHTPDAYYEQLEERLANNPIQPAEHLEELKRHRILVDYDEKGYLLQIFTKPLQDRPTLVLEVIQRRNHSGFGAGNFLALFKAIEAETERRGNLS